MAERDFEEVWPGWKRGRLIGEGSFGRVYEAVHEEHGVLSRAAVKVIRIPERGDEVDCLKTEGLGEDETGEYFRDLVDQCVKEIQVMNSFKGAPHIVHVEDYRVLEQEEGAGWEIYIRMELLTPLTVYLSDQTLGEAEIVRLGIDICSALEYCAARNILHRDIKPGNLFVSPFGGFKLGDFGIARTMENVSAGMSTRGTFNYMAPEVYRGESFGYTADLYSLGLVLYLLSNRRKLPFLNVERTIHSHSERMDALKRRLSGEVLPPPCEASPAFSEVIAKACAENPAERYQTAAEMKEALFRLSGGSVGEPEKQKKKRKFFVPAALLAVVLFAVYGGFRIAPAFLNDQKQSQSSEALSLQTEADLAVPEADPSAEAASSAAEADLSPSKRTEAAADLESEEAAPLPLVPDQEVLYLQELDPLDRLPVELLKEDYCAEGMNWKGSLLFGGTEPEEAVYYIGDAYTGLSLTVTLDRLREEYQGNRTGHELTIQDYESGKVLGRFDLTKDMPSVSALLDITGTRFLKIHFTPHSKGTILIKDPVLVQDAGTDIPVSGRREWPETFLFSEQAPEPSFEGAPGVQEESFFLDDLDWQGALLLGGEYATKAVWYLGGNYQTLRFACMIDQSRKEKAYSSAGHALKISDPESGAVLYEGWVKYADSAMTQEIDITDVDFLQVEFIPMPTATLMLKDLEAD